MSSWKIYARQALRGALETRYRANIAREDPVCVYDLAERLGVEVRFHAGNTFGGMYAKASKTILVPSLRPAGRRAFTCGHELGHWYFSHGDRIDGFWAEDGNNSPSPEEQLVNLFAGHLLMPRWAVVDAFSRRKIDPNSSSPSQIYSVACQLGVGYQTLIQQMLRSHLLLEGEKATELLKTTPKEIRYELDPFDIESNVVLVDSSWRCLAVDLEVADRAILPSNISLEGNCVTPQREGKQGVILVAVQPGIAKVSTPDGWSSYIRVSRAKFEGRSIYRHMEDPDAN